MKNTLENPIFRHIFLKSNGMDYFDYLQPFILDLVFIQILIFEKLKYNTILYNAKGRNLLFSSNPRASL